MKEMVDVEHNIFKMGATSNINTTKLANLQERKKTIEESLAKCNQELRELCIQEADLTGILPLEMPLEPGESPPSIRRRVGTSFQIPENLIKNTNNKDESIAELELQIQLHANMAEAALGLANEQNISKTVRRQHMGEYQQHKSQYTALQDKLTILKERLQQSQNTEQLQYKQKKKPRPIEQDDNISINNYSNDAFNKSDVRHSMRSARGTDLQIDNQRYSIGNPKMIYMNQNLCLTSSNSRYEENVVTGLYGLSINGYKNYMENRENFNNIHKSPVYNTQLSPNSYHNSQIQTQLHNQYKSSNNFKQFSSRSNSTQNSPQQQIYNYQINNLNYSQEHLFNNNNINTQNVQQQSSPNNSVNTNSKLQSPYYPTNTLQNQLHYHKYYQSSDQTFNPHQIQPHQQYEDNIVAPGLGGYWKQSESGEMIWCNSINNDSNWQRDKRFGSLDRRKNRRLHKRMSPSVNNKSATLSSVPTYSEHIRSASIKTSQVVNRRAQDNRQLIRTQSLGSVGVQTVDSVWRSDDNSSCESDNRSINDISHGTRKLKEKEWVETSLDGPVSPTHSIKSQTQTILNSNDDYFVSSPSTSSIHIQSTSPTSPSKQIFEIPAESNPSPRIPDTNIELFNNNNIPKNCTIVQAGHCKPYHEETKPFEMSDFYKYSTKFKKSPVKQEKFSSTNNDQNLQKNLCDTFDVVQKSNNNNNNVYHHQKSTGRNHSNFNSNNSNSPSTRLLDNSGTLSSSFDLNQIGNTNVAEHFSNEMNTWYKNQQFHNNENNNNNAVNTNAKNKSTATLV